MTNNSTPKEERIWRTSEGKDILISDMSTAHLQNALAMLYRMGYVSPVPYEHKLFCLGSPPVGEMAYAEWDHALYTLDQYAENESPAIDWIVEELREREECVPQLRKECSSCRHWRGNDASDQAECMALLAAVDITVDCDYHWGITVKTGGSFGCAKWEARNDRNVS